MLLRIAKATPNVFLKSFRHSKRALIPRVQPFSSLLNDQNSNFGQPLTETKENKFNPENLPSINVQVNSYMSNLFRYLAAASVLGITSAHLFTLVIPAGNPSAYLILAGIAFDHLGSEYIASTKPIPYIHKDREGNIRAGTTNSGMRKLAFLSSCIGYGCILGSVFGLVPLTPSILPLSAITCLFSTLGHLNYCKFAPKTRFSTKHLFVSGMLTGILGLNLITSGSTILMWENPLHLESIEVASYVGLLLYNLFTGHDSKKAIEDVHNGKGDYLSHANKFGENWLCSLVPHVILNMQ